jgi:Na+-translocating ferredoxin:NAD+ oxidoreductase RnfA subunit
VNDPIASENQMTEPLPSKADASKDHWPQIEYHSGAVYRNLEIFLKVTLALCGGLAYLVVNKISGDKHFLSYVITIASILEISLGIFIVIAILLHVRAQIKIYNLLPPYTRLFGWVEPYAIIFILGMSSAISYIASFKIIPAVTSGG